MQPSSCLNCDNPIDETHNYCPQCGQKSSIRPLSFHDLGHDVIHYITHADKSIFSLLNQLITKPGIVAREYVSGKRMKYFNPLNFFLIVAGIVVFMTSINYSPVDKRSNQIELAAKKVSDPVKKQAMLEMAGRMKLVNQITSKYSNFINMMATPLLAFFFWLFYRKKYNYVESLVANMYFIGVIMLVYALLIVPLQHFLPARSNMLIGIFFLFEIIYRGHAFYQFADRKGTVQIIKGYGVSFLLTLIWFLFTFSLISTYIKTGF